MARSQSKPIPQPVPTATEAHLEASQHRQARDARRTQLVEDYVELVADLIDGRGEARPVDIARRLGVTPATVSKMLKRLADDGLIAQRPYRGVFLTDAGRTIAEASRSRHRIVEAFLLSLGISAENARIDAEGMEHHVSPETLKTFEKLSSTRSKWTGVGE